MKDDSLKHLKRKIHVIVESSKEKAKNEFGIIFRLKIIDALLILL